MPAALANSSVTSLLNESAHNSTSHRDKCCSGSLWGREGGVGKGDTASSLPDDMQGLSRWAETWSPYPGLHCDSQQVTREHHWKSISPCSLIVRKKLPCLQHHIISQDNLTFIYFCLFLSSSLSFPPSLTLSPLWDVLAGWLFGRLCNRSWLDFILGDLFDMYTESFSD